MGGFMAGFHRVLLVGISVLTLFAFGCSSNKPIYNIAGAPVATNKANPTLEDVAAAIQRAGAGLGWQMQSTAPGRMIGTLSLRNHQAVVDVSYTPKTYSISYKTSNNLDADGKTIHGNYNGWIQNLDKAIQTQLRLL